MAPSVVLDTNVVLDWLLFEDPATAALRQAIEAGQVRWLASAALRAELAHVLGRGIPARPSMKPGAVLDAWTRWTVPVEPDARASPRDLRCTDPDDQKFIDLAIQTGAAMLISRDRAVLRLARRARAHGLTIAAVFDPAAVCDEATPESRPLR